MFRTGKTNKPFAIGAFVALVALFLSLFAGVAAAQEPTISVDPETVPEEGEYTLTVSGEGFTAGNALFILPCTAPDGDASAISGETDCDISDLTPVTVEDDGTFSTEVTYTVGADFAIAAGDAGSTEAASVLVPIEGSEDSSEATETTEEPDDSEATDTEDPEALAETGWETNLLVFGAIMLLGAGYFANRASNRLV